MRPGEYYSPGPVFDNRVRPQRGSRLASCPSFTTGRWLATALRISARPSTQATDPQSGSLAWALGNAIPNSTRW